MIETENLRKVYGDGTVAIEDLSFKLSSRFSCIIGRNGAGKTTLLRILSTQLLPTKGRATINGYDVVREVKKVRKIISSIPQEASPFGIASPLEHVIVYLTARGFSFSEALSSARRALKEVGLGDAMNKPADELSGGMKRKIFVAMALSSNAEVVFLDEPTTGLDPVSRLEVWSVIKEMSSNMVLTTHYMEEAEELCQDIAMMHKGKLIAQGSPEELLSSLKGIVRVEGTGNIKIGSMRISYVDEDGAKKMVGKGVVIKPTSLEDVFIMRGLYED
ncbi:MULTISPECIES: ABC transporter ATP-binding protein [Acidianus]|uniref:Multidrug ABC transporter ATPase n=1 Tax=Candidatus Acidianus copahuensis TaxID=1160895 RepID=A0A031LNA4_9CREN|nr:MULTISPECIES: ABC transporter ATP-binding protein [Acidianus]EZQ04890.1 multidrug ABC transporter ATPase [Candidatus Acidianus copahuensis]NON61322.1 ABC transporter ATP-binding protein [Acidianus sp. RZ1]